MRTATRPRGRTKPSALDKVNSAPVKQTQADLLANLPTPNPGRQQEFIDCDADIVVYGGAAFAGKTYALLIDFGKGCGDSLYRSVIFRRTSPQITNEGGLWDTATEIYPKLGAIANQTDHEYRFPSGASVRFAHLQHEKTKLDWQGSQLVRCGYDELTHFTEGQFWYLLSRVRSPSGIPTKIRATTNPDADSWVAKLLDWWIAPDGYPDQERAGVIRWFVRINGELIWGDSWQDLYDQMPDKVAIPGTTEVDESTGLMPKSFTFIPGTIFDNKPGIKADPGYLGSLQAMHPVERDRLLGGNWRVKMEAGTVFDRTWFEIVDSVPDGGIEYRFWDLAATAREVAKQTSFYTCGVKLKRIGNIFYVLDVNYAQVSPAKVPDLIFATANQDAIHCPIRWELEGGSAGKILEAALKEKLGAWNAMAIKPKGDKVTRAIPAARAAYQGRVKLLRSPWNDTFLSAVQSFDGTPKPLTNDVVDSFDGAFDCADSQIITYDMSKSFG